MQQDAKEDSSTTFSVGFRCDIDPAVADADEKVARELASFLYSVVLPLITKVGW